MNIRVWLATVCVLVAICGGCNLFSPANFNRQHNAMSEDELLSAHPRLAEYFAHWQEEVNLAGEQWPGYSDLGVFPIGNGRIFAHEGTRYPLGTLTNVVGPTYQKNGFLGDIVPLVYAGQEVVAWQTQRVRWVKPGGIVNTESRTAEGLRLATYDFVPPDLPVICRIMIVSNEGETPQRAVSLALAFGALNAEVIEGGIRLQRGSAVIQAGFLGAKTRLKEGTPDIPLPEDLDRETGTMLMGENAPVLRCELGTFRPGESVAKLAYFVITKDEDEGAELLKQVRERGFALVDDTYEYWRQWHERTVTVETPQQPEVGELLTISKYLCAVQQADEGGFSPMDGYSYTWIRDSNGPVRCLSAFGDFEAVRRHLEYHFRGCALESKIGNNLRLDLDITGEISQPDWAQVRVEPAESSSFVILQHYWYYRQSGDLELIREHWPMLRRCLLGQAVDERGLLPFHGDETYRFPGYTFFEDGRDVDYYVNLETRSADSGFEYVAAAEALAEMAKQLGRTGEATDYRKRADRVRRATEEYYWQKDRGYYAPAMSEFADQRQTSPFAPINMRPLWIGYAPDTARQRQNVLESLKYLWREEGTLKTTPEFEPYVTMIPGYGLYALAAIGHPAAQVALNGVLAAAEKSGGFAEMNEPDNRPSDEIWGQHRIRPWEGGINAEAILHYLTGVEVDAASGRVYLRPQMPASWQEMRISNLPVGPARLNLEVTRDGVTVMRTDESNFELALMAAPLHSDLGEVMSVPVVSGKAIKRPAPDSSFPDWPEQALPLAQAFDWGGPQVPAGTKTVVFTWSKETAQECRAKYGPRTVVFDIKLPWPAEFFRAALLRSDGRRRVDTLVLDVSHFPGAFKREEFWAENGPGGQIVAAFNNAGGQVAEPPTIRKRGAGLAGLPH